MRELMRLGFYMRVDELGEITKALTLIEDHYSYKKERERKI
jgi:hypothetical protein